MIGRVLYGITAGISAGTLLRGQLAAMRESGWDVVLASAPDDRARRAAQVEGVRFEPVAMAREISLAGDVRALGAWLALIRRVRPDVVNVSTPKAGLLGGLAARALGVPRRVYVMRGLRLEGATGNLRRILWLMERLAVAAATDVVVVSESLAAAARSAGVLRPGRAWLVGEGSSNGVRADQVAERAATPGREARRAELGLAEGDTVIGYVGRIVADKGIGALLDAFAQVDDPRARLLLIGSMDEEPLRAAVAALGERAVHVDWTDDVWSYYPAMDALCLPTRREGFPNVVLEAAAVGVPTITTRATGAVDAVVDRVTGLLVDVDAPGQLATAIRALVADPAGRRALGAAARERVAEHFTPEHIWSGIESIMRGAPAPHVRRI